MKKIGVFDLGISNLASVLNALKYIGADYDLISDKNSSQNFDKLILPGVGTFSSGMRALKERGLDLVIQNQVIKNKIPIFGICLGMQLFFEESEESKDVSGLSILEGKIVKLAENINYQIPRIGWAQSEFKKDFLGFETGFKADFYYIHSYHANPKNREIITITSQDDLVVGAIKKDNIFGCQFHPEKSHVSGIELIKKFTEI